MNGSPRSAMLAPPLGPLAPCSGLLLPAPSRLAGPHTAPERATPFGTDRARSGLDDVASQSGQAINQAKQLAARAAAAASHRPAVQFRARLAATKGAAGAGRLARAVAAFANRHAEAARETPAAVPRPGVVRQRSRASLPVSAILIGSAALGVTILAGGAVLYSVLSDRATANASARLRATLAAYAVSQVVHYDSIVASPLGVTTLTHLTAGPFNGIAISAKTLHISNVAWHGAALAGFHAELNGVALPLLQIARRNPAPFLRAAIGLGYAAPKADIVLDMNFDDARQTLTIAASGAIGDAGTATLTATLVGLTSDAAKAVLRAPISAAASALASGGVQPLSLVAASVNDNALPPQLALAQARLVVDDATLAARMRQIPDQDVPDDGSRPPALPPGMVMALHDALPPGWADAAAQTVASWLSAGGRLTVDLHPAVPVSFSRQDFLAGAGLDIGK